MILKKVFFILICLYSTNLLSANIRVVDLEKIIDKNNELNNFITDITNDQIQHREKFSKIELNLKSELERIDGLKLILDNLELEKEINAYNEKLNNFNNQINIFNNHYEEQILSFKNEILEEVLKIMKNYALDNQIDLILDSNNYILSSNNINITNVIVDEINKIKFNRSIEKFK